MVMKKAKKNDSPVLVIGLGGTGADALLKIKSDFKERFEPLYYADGSIADKPMGTECTEIDTDPFPVRMHRHGSV